jgi:tetratricopeptide (TPR) repeat protein
MLVGRFAEAEALAQQALELGQRLEVSGPRQAWMAQLIILRAEQGRLAELLPAIEGMAHVGDGSLTVECFAAWIYTDVGDPRARGILDRIMADGLRWLPDYHSGVAQAAVLAHVCASLGAAEYAPRLYEILAPLRGRLIVRSRLACHGPAAYSLGLLAGLCGRSAEARELLEESLELTERIGAKPYEARTSQALARRLLAEGDGADRPRAFELIRRSVAIAEEIDMRGLLAAGRELEQEDGGATPLRRRA